MCQKTPARLMVGVTYAADVVDVVDVVEVVDVVDVR